MLKKIICIICLAYPFRTFSQEEAPSGELIGKVLEAKTNVKLPYATIVLKDTIGNIISGIITDEEGHFHITKIPNGTFLVEIQYNGFENYNTYVTLDDINRKINLGIIGLNEKATDLDEVIIVGKGPQTSFRLDKKIFRVSDDILSQSGFVTDVLGNIPSISVSPSGVISLRGNNNVSVLINGKKSSLTQSQILEQIPANSIERVEVITNPSARYDASGAAGIINIIIKKNKKEGFSGQVGTTLGSPKDYRLNGSLSYKTDRFNLFSNAGIRYTDYVGLYLREQSIQNEAIDNVFLDQQQDENRHDDEKLISLGADFYLNEQNTLTASFFSNETKDIDQNLYNYNYFVSDIRDSTLITNTDSRQRRNFNKIEINYAKLFKEESDKFTFNVQYDFWDSNKNTRIETNKLFPLNEPILNLRTNSKDKRKNFVIQSDYTNSTFEAGAKFENRIVTNEFVAEEFVDDNFQLIDNLDNDLDYKERIFGIYAQFGKQIKKISYLIGLRMEYTYIDIEDKEQGFQEINEYSQFFPSVNIKYILKESTSLKLSYSRRINRPRLWQLSPFFELTDFNSRILGNPRLIPVFTNGIELSVLYVTEGFTLNPSIYYSNSKNTIQNFTIQDENDLFITSLFNLERETRYGFEILAMYKPLNWIRINGEFNFYGFEQKGAIPTQSFNFSDSRWYSNLNTQISISKRLKLRTALLFQAASNNSQTKIKPITSLNIGITQNLFGDKASLAFNGSNILNTNKSREVIKGSDFLIDQTRNRNAARWSLNFIYRINKKEEN